MIQFVVSFKIYVFIFLTLPTKTGYTVGGSGESCKTVCEGKSLACDPVMTADGSKVLQRLGVDCSSSVPYNAQDQAEPYITSNGVCHGLTSITNSSCEISKPSTRRLCRCEQPGTYTYAS